MTTGFSDISLDVFAIIVDNVTELQSLFTLAQTCRTFRQLLVDSSRKIGERAFLRIGRSHYAFFDEALLFGRIQNIPFEDLPQYDIQSKQFLNIPTKEWFTAMSQKLPLSQILGPRSLTTSYYKTWVHDFLDLNRNLSLAFEWVPNKMPKKQRAHSTQGPRSPSLLGSENAKFNALLIGFFIYQIFTHLFGPHIFTSPIQQALGRAQELSKEDTTRGKKYQSFLNSLAPNRVHDRRRDMSRFELYHRLIQPRLGQHPLHRDFHRGTDAYYQVFAGFFDWFFDGETPSTGKLKCYLLWAASSEMAEYDVNSAGSLISQDPSYLQRYLSMEPATNPSRVLYGSTTLLPCQSTPPSLWIGKTATHDDIMGYWRARHLTTRNLTRLHPQIIARFCGHVCSFYDLVLDKWMHFKASYERQHADVGGSRKLKSWRGVTEEIIDA